MCNGHTIITWLTPSLLGFYPQNQPPVSYRRSSLDLRSLQASSLLQPMPALEQDHLPSTCESIQRTQLTLSVSGLDGGVNRL